ncbi:MAG: hypothetical protein IT372_22190 [Polyangiaceae bacterium]|nr:hypothetical protein [Polyangiaceae bacterium]
MSGPSGGLRDRRAPSVRRLGAVAIAVALLAGACNLSWFNDDCALTSTCPGDNCPGQCVPLPPLGFDGPALLWVGPEDELPDCPTDAPSPFFLGKGDVDDSDQCPSCECTEEVCMLPSSVTASTLACPGGGTATEYTMPGSWAGACTPLAPAPPAPLASLTSAPVTVRPCEPVAAEVPAGGPPRFPPPLVAKACEGEVVDTVCNDPALTCVPSAKPPPPGFRQCIARDDGDEPPCPTAYPDKLTFYREIYDTRSCSPCECTEVSPSSCIAEVRFYEDSACNTLVAQAEPVLGASACAPANPGSTLGGVEAELLIDEPGACVASGGGQLGQVERIGRTVFCCQPLP